MSVSPTVWLPETIANPADITGNQNQAGIIQCADGSFWVTWRDFVDAGAGLDPGVDIIGQRYDALGQPIGSAVRLNPAAFVANDERDPAYAADAAGDGFYMAFESADIADNAHVDIVLARLDETGTTLSTLAIANDPTGDAAPNNLRNPDVAMIGPANGLVVWERTNEAGDTDIRARFFDPSTNTALGNAFTLADSTDNKTEPQVVALANGTYAVIWIDEFLGSATQHDLAFAVIGNGGATLASGTITAGSGNETVGSVVALAGGGFIVSWTDAAAENGNVQFARFDDAGVQQGATQTVAGGANAQGDNHLFATADGGFGIVWEDSSAGRIFTRVYAADGTPQSTRVQVDDAVTTSPLESLLLGDGRVLVAYAQFDPVSASNDPHFTIIDPRGAPNGVPAYADGLMVGTTGADTLIGASGFAELYGWDGDDVIIDNAAVAERLDGGIGNDRIEIIGTDFDDVVAGGDGFDTLVLQSLAESAFTVDFRFRFISGTALGTSFSGIEAFEYTGSAQATIIDTSAALAITTGSGADTITLDGGADTVSAGDGDDLLEFTGTSIATGLAVDLGAGENTISLTGFSGTAESYWSLGLGLHGAGGFGDAVVSAITGATHFVGGHTRRDHVTGTSAANLIDGGGGDDELLGSGGDDTLIGSLGNDTLDGGSALDSLVGGTGNDLYVVNQQADIVDETGGDGIDTVQSSVSWTLTTGFENTILTGTATHAWGNPLGNVITGNDVDNTFYAGGGDDTLLGGGGNDYMAGSVGVDSMDGGLGDDIFILDNADELALISDAGGIDEVRFSFDRFTIPDMVETVRLQGSAITAGGNDFDNSVIGNAVGNALWGYLGNDKLYGYGGADTLRAAEGEDTLFGGGADDVLYGGSEADLMRGDPGHDDLNGEDGDDNLGGGDGNDSLDGGAGRDILQGNAGVDLFYFDDGDFSGLGNLDADRILDFVPGEDRIMVVGVDAITGGADDRFTWIGTAAFSNTAGELRYGQANGTTLVEGDTDGDGQADIAIALTGTLTLSAADFSL